MVLFSVRNDYDMKDLLVLSIHEHDSVFLDYPINLKIKSLWQVDLVGKTDTFQSACGFKSVDNNFIALWSPDIVPLLGQDFWVQLSKKLKFKLEYSLVNEEEEFDKIINNYLKV